MSNPITVSLEDKIDFLKRNFNLKQIDDESQIREIAELMQVSRSKAGEEIITAGEKGEAMYFIGSGSVEVRKDDKVIDVLEAGDFFGEMALMTGEPRSATVIAREDTELLVIMKFTFDKLIKRDPSIREIFEQIIAERKTKNENLEQDSADDMLELLQRTQSDFDNYRRRETTRNQKTKLENTREIILEFLPALDNFRRASEHLPEDLKNNDWATGILAVEKQLEKALENLGLHQIKSIGEKPNPHLHQVIGIEQSDDAESGIIIEELEAGYMLGDDVIRDSKVKVAE